MLRYPAKLVLLVILSLCVTGSSCQKQRAPVAPGVPNGPSSGEPGVSYVFRVAATDPDGGQVCCKFDWGDGKVSPWSRYVASDTEVSFSHKWDTAGSYAVKALAQDERGSESGWSPNLDVAIAASSQNQAPGNPGVPSGTTSGEVGVSYDYTASASDPEMDSIALRFDWGDSSISDWSNFYPRDSTGTTTVLMSHSWGSADTYSVKAQAKDTKGAESGWSEALTVVIATGGGNNPPGTPSTPSGPSSGTVGTSYDFSSSATDPDVDSVAIRFDWGDGNTSGWSNLAPGGTTVTLSHAWTSAGTFGIRAQARDSMGLVSNWSAALSITISSGGNQPPGTPTTPSGPSSGNTGVSYGFTSSATDPDGDNTALRFSWGDGDTSNWSAYYLSGTAVTEYHVWSSPNTYTITSQAKDEHNATSGWSSGCVLTIGGNQTITVTSPNGGEGWCTGQTFSITWTASNIASYRLWYSTNGGTSWKDIGTTSSENYSWTIPYDLSTTCRVKVADAADGTPFDISDANFTIAGFHVTSPNGGENWQVGSSHDITWSYVGEMALVDLYYSANSGNTWFQIGDDWANSGSYTWVVPNTPSTQCRIEVADGWYPVTYDASDANFTISSSAPDIDTLKYDDGTQSSTVAWNYSDWGWGACFVPSSYPRSVTGALVHFYDNSWPDPGGNRVKLIIIDDNGAGGSPGTVLWQSGILTCTRGAWSYFSIPGVQVTSGGFYLFYVQPDAYPDCPGLSYDANCTYPTPWWMYQNGNYVPDTASEFGDYMIRAVVSSTFGGSDVLTPTRLGAAPNEPPLTPGLVVENNSAPSNQRPEPVFPRPVAAPRQKR